VTVEELFNGFGSLPELIDAVLLRTPVAFDGTMKVTLMTALPPEAIDAIVHGSELHAPLTDVGVKAGVAVSVTEMLVAVDGPELLTVIVYATA
jgi:hypothetical protein